MRKNDSQTEGPSPVAREAAANEADEGLGEGEYRPSGGPPVLTVHTSPHGRLLFHNEADMRYYLWRAQMVYAQFEIRVHGYLLLADSVMWLLSTSAPEADGHFPPREITRAQRTLHTEYSKRLNLLYHVAPGLDVTRSHSNALPALPVLVTAFRRRSGQNFLDHGPKLLASWEEARAQLRMMELLPQCRGLVHAAQDYPFSSLRAHLGLPGILALDQLHWPQLSGAPQAEANYALAWSRYLGLDPQTASSSTVPESSVAEKRTSADTAGPPPIPPDVTPTSFDQDAGNWLEYRWPSRLPGMKGRLRHYLKLGIAYWKLLDLGWLANQALAQSQDWAIWRGWLAWITTEASRWSPIGMRHHWG